ncbi:hypothetical protein Tco_1121781 [Tanacetum coccineum]|uniref:Uncharacterized protein n=1 Tax=Tanacetum coccineum TaxID=301880 RepID=A0ABQ5IYP0_9ASTR
MKRIEGSREEDELKLRSDPSEDPSSNHIPPLPAISPFLSSTDDSSDSDTPNTPPSPTHGTPFTKMTLFTQSTPVASGALCRRVMILALGQPIPHGRLYCYHLNRLVHMMTARKRVGPLPTHRLAVRYSVDYSSSDHFASDDSSGDSSSSSSSETSLDDLSDSLSDHSLPAPSSDHLMILLLRVFFTRGVDPLLHLYRYLHLYREHCLMRVLIFYHHLRGLEVRVHGRILEVSSTKWVLSRLDDEFIAYANALRVRGIDARVVVEAVDREEIETVARGPVEVRVDRVSHPMIANDILKSAQEEGAVEVTYKTLGDLVQRTMPNTRSGASRTREGINEQIDRRMAGALGARDAAKNLEPLIGGEEMEMEEMGTDEEMAITSEDLCLLESAHIKTN